MTSLPRAILVDVIPPSCTPATAERRMAELELLTRTYGGMVIVKRDQKRTAPDYQTYIGKGKLDALIEEGRAHNADLLIVNNLLKPKQLFEIEERLRRAKTPMKAWDRVDLILKIFDKHAKTNEAKLQIKLAAIKHMGPRIFGMGFEMMQQVGGVGVRGGQGETNTELMKRHLAQQEKHIRKELERVAATRALHRARRTRMGLKTVSLVGYTNAGKSSLLNALTKKGAYVANALFATLDTRVGELVFPSETGAPQKILLSDTIGFIQDLPPQLIDAFRSTLEETVEADLLLHVIDASDPHVEEKIRDVELVLQQIGAHDLPTLYVFNKSDLGVATPRSVLKKRYAAYEPVFVSAASGAGIPDLKARIASKVPARA